MEKSAPQFQDFSVVLFVRNLKYNVHNSYLLSSGLTSFLFSVGNIKIKLININIFQLMVEFITGWQPPEREDPADTGGGAELGGRHQPLGPGLPRQWHPLLSPLLPGPRPVPPGQGNPGPQSG